jgi:hypothetical protein
VHRGRFEIEASGAANDVFRRCGLMKNPHSAIDPELLRLPDGLGRVARDKVYDHRQIIRYPRFVNRMPLDWIATACKLKGRAVHVALAIWDLSSLSKSSRVRLTKRQLGIFGVQRHSAYRALKQLEQASLITVERRNGRAPVVTIAGRYYFRPPSINSHVRG